MRTQIVNLILGGNVAISQFVQWISSDLLSRDTENVSFTNT